MFERLFVEQAISERDALKARMEKAELALKMYLRRGHHDTCSASICNGYACDCGKDLAAAYFAESAK